MTPAPLDGIRVANFGWVWAGPVVGQTLAFLGAEVYKIESEARIDMARTIPPFADGVRDHDRSLSHHAGWAGNGSVTINLKEPEGIEVALEFVSHCDVVIENFGPGVMERLGLGYEELRSTKSDVDHVLHACRRPLRPAVEPAHIRIEPGEHHRSRQHHWL